VPTQRANATVVFHGSTADDAFFTGAKAVKTVSQMGLQPTNLRLVYGSEIGRMAQEDGLENLAVLLIGFEAADESQDLDRMMRSALHVCKELGGTINGQPQDTYVRKGGGGERDGIAGKWGAGFMRGGYIFSAAALTGMVVNTFETAVTWDGFFQGFHSAVLAATRKAVQEHCGSGTVTCRFTHVYPDGPAAYYTVIAQGEWQPKDHRVDQWQKVKSAAMEAVMSNGGTATHHHAVGKLHREHYHSELGSLFKGTLEAVKRAHDPAWVLNPGVLLEPKAKL